MDEHPDEDALVKTLEGRMIDAIPDRSGESVRIEVDNGTGFDLTPRGAAQFAEQLRIAAAVASGEIETDEI